MKNKSYFRSEKQKQLLNKAMFPKNLAFKEQIRVLMWTIFDDKKWFKFLEHLESGMSTRKSYLETKK